MFYNKYCRDVLGNTGAVKATGSANQTSTRRGGAVSGEFYYLHCLSKFFVDRIHDVSLNQLGDSQLDIVKSFNKTSGSPNGSPARSGNSPQRSARQQVDTRHKRTWHNAAVETKVPMSKSHTYQLKKAKALATKAREAAAKGGAGGMMSMNGTLQDEMAYLSKVNRSLQKLHGVNRGLSRQKAQMLAGDDSLMPNQKLEVIKLEIHRLLSHPLDQWEQREEEEEEKQRRLQEDEAGSQQPSAAIDGSKKKETKKKKDTTKAASSKPHRRRSFPPSMAVSSDYESLNEFCIVQVALCKLQFGDWCLEAAAAEYDLAVSYLLIGQPVMAREHAQAARKAAQAVLDKDPLLEIKADLAEACATILIGHGGVAASSAADASSVISPDSSSGAKAVTLATRATEAFAKQQSLAPQDAAMFPFHYVKCAALFLQGANHQRALDAMDDALASCGDRQGGEEENVEDNATATQQSSTSYPPRSSGWSDVMHVHILKMAVHFDLLARVTQELMALPIRSSKQKLLAQLSEVSTKDQLAMVSSQLQVDVETLNEKKKSLQLTMVRQGQQIQTLLQASLGGLDLGARADIICPEQLMQLGQILHSCCRAAWIGQQHDFASQTAAVAAVMLTTALGESDMISLQVAVDEALLAAGSSVVPSATFLSRWQQRCRPLDPTTASSTSATSTGQDVPMAGFVDSLQKVADLADGGQTQGSKSRDAKTPRAQRRRRSIASSRSSRSSNQSYTQSDSSSESDRGAQHDVDEDEDSAVARRARGREKLEEVLPKVTQAFGAASGVAHSISTDLEKAYARSGETYKESIHTAVLCDIYSTLLGPMHPKTCQKLAEFELKQKKVHAPLFSPSWGVCKLLDTITLTTATDGADIYFTTTGETPCEDQGVHQSLSYMGPIVLDTIGRVTIKAFAVRDGRQSGVVEAQYSVMKK